MKPRTKESNDEIFETFLIKEQELSYMEKKHAQVAIMRMAKDFKEKEEKATWITKITDFFQDIKESYQLDKLKYKSEKKISKLKEEDKSDKKLEHLIHKRNDFKVHTFLERKLIRKTIIADCGCVEIPTIEYYVYIRIEYIPAELWTSKHCEETFTNYEQAMNYFEQLKEEYKDKTAQIILNHLTEKIDNHCKHLNENIKVLTCN